MNTTGAKADCIYGATGSTKTSRLGDAAEYVKRRHGKRSRLASCDPGGWEPIQPLVDDGLIEAYAISPMRPNVIETLDKLSKGWWPKDCANPNSILLPPAQSRWAEFGGAFFESATSWCDVMMQIHTTDLTNVRVPEMPKDSMIVSGDYKRRFTGRSDYGGVQDAIASMISQSGHIPVAKVVWTALEAKGEDEAGKPVYGPEFTGKKATGKCGPWFGNLLHLDFVPVELEVLAPVGEGKMKVLKPAPFLFLRQHIDPADPYKLVYPAKTRAPRTLWQKVPDFLPPDLNAFYTLMDSLAADEIARRGSKDAAALPISGR